METNNKYYTPDITEFRIGFECEIWRNKTTLEIENPLVTDNVEWTKSIIKTPMSGHMINWQNWPSIKYLLKIGSIRCKFLDKEDLESFGFKCQWYEKGEYSFVKDDILISVNDIDIKKLFITNMKCGMDIRKCLFQGIIKNKSELKVLLKQLQLL